MATEFYSAFHRTIGEPMSELDDKMLAEIRERIADNFRELGADEWRSQYRKDVSYLLSRVAAPKVDEPRSVVPCDQCCWKDRCDKPEHFYRESCPYCKGSGFVAAPIEDKDEDHATS